MYKTHSYLINAPHRISITLIGCGGTGSLLLPRLARLDYALRKLGHNGLYVSVVDGDFVEEKNILRQNFVEEDLGMNKAVSLISKINMAFDLDWNAYDKFIEKKDAINGNILISCVDNVITRELIRDGLRRNKNYNDTLKNLLWFDCGNKKDSGQVIMSNNSNNDDSDIQLKNIFDIYGDLTESDTEEIQGKGCSDIDSLKEQDLTINDEMAHICWNMLWTLFKDKRISYQAVFSDLKTMNRSTMKV